MFNAEVSDGEDYKLTITGRFKHSKEYLDQLAQQNNLQVLEYKKVILRTENQTPVLGYLYLLKKQA